MCGTKGCSPLRKQGAAASAKGWQVVFITAGLLLTGTAQSATSADQNSSFVRNLPAVERLCLEPDRKHGLLKPAWFQHNEGQHACKPSLRIL